LRPCWSRTESGRIVDWRWFKGDQLAIGSKVAMLAPQGGEIHIDAYIPPKHGIYAAPGMAATVIFPDACGAARWWRCAADRGGSAQGAERPARRSGDGACWCACSSSMPPAPTSGRSRRPAGAGGIREWLDAGSTGRCGATGALTGPI